MSEADLESARSAFPGEATIGAEVSSQGKGASGPAIAVVVELERVLTDAGSLIATGTALFALIHRVRRRFNRDPVVEDSNTIGALAAASSHADLTGYRFVDTVPITARPGVGTDARDIWATCFAGSDKVGDAVVVFMSPTGTCLGEVRVPAEMYFADDGWRRRGPEDIRIWWVGN